MAIRSNLITTRVYFKTFFDFLPVCFQDSSAFSCLLLSSVLHVPFQGSNCQNSFSCFFHLRTSETFALTLKIIL